nr:hypothetical protein [Tanacetum cinerariifolium]
MIFDGLVKNINNKDRATIAKSSTLPHDSAPRVTSPITDEGSMQPNITELTLLCTSLQRQHSELLAKFQAQEVKILKLKERVQILEDREGIAATRSGDDAPIKGRSMDEGKVATERISDDIKEMATVLTSIDAATILVGGIDDVTTGSGSIPTAGPPAVDIPTGSEVVPTASPVFATATMVTPYSRRKGKEVMVESDTPKKQRLQEQINAQVARELEEQQEREDKRMSEQIARDAEMRSMGELTLFLGLQVKQKKDGIFISQDKYVAEILKKFGLSEGKSASTPIDAEKPLLKDSDGKDVDVHTYRSMIGSLMYLTSSRSDIIFAVKQKKDGIFISQDKYVAEILKKFGLSEGKSTSTPIDTEKPLLKDSDGKDVDVHTYRLISWQCKKQIVIATSSTKAEYVAAASGYAQVLWIQNQLLDYGHNFMHTVIYIDNSSCYLRNVVIEIAVLNIFSDALPITTNGIQLTMSNPQERVDSP